MKIDWKKEIKLPRPSLSWLKRIRLPSFSKPSLKTPSLKAPVQRQWPLILKYRRR